MNFEHICRLYRLGALQSITPLRPGTVARVWKLETDSGPFLLRTLTGREQGEREWAIAEHLTARGFTRFPAIRTTEDGAPYVEVDDIWCQVQEFSPGKMPDPAVPGTPAKIAETAVALIQALSSCSGKHGAKDRFDLTAVWGEYRHNWPLLDLPIPLEEADRRASRLASLPVRETQVIHGDLGLWNMLDGPEGIRVIDFGEARLGDPYFDLASALGGLINHSTPEDRAKHVSEFLSACRDRMPLDRERLSQQLQLWVWRGLAQCVRAPEEWRNMAARFYNALSWAEENLHEL